MRIRIWLILVCCLLLSGCLTSMLYIGVASSNPDLVRDELKDGANPNQIYYSYPLLLLAAEKGDSDVVRMLIDSKAELHTLRSTESSSIPPFGLYRDELLTEYPSTITTYDALCAASFSGKPKVIKQILNAGFDLSRATPHPVLCAMQGSQPLQALQTLLSAGVTPASAKDAALMHRAVANTKDKKGLIHFLAEQGIDVDQPLPQSTQSLTGTWTVEKNMPPLATAIARSSQDPYIETTVLELLNAGANPNLHSPDGNSLLALASAAECQVCVVQLLAAGAKLDNPIWKKLPKEQQIERLASNSAEIISMLIDSNALPPTTNSFTTDLIDRFNQKSTDRNQLLYDPNRPNSYQQALLKHQQVVPGEIGQELRREVEAKERARQKQLEIARREAEAKMKAQLAAERKAQEARRRAQEQERLAREQQRAIQAQKQKHVDQAIKATWEQSVEFDQLLSTLGNARARCENHKKLYRAVKDQRCSYMNKYKNWSTSDACEALKKDMKKSISKNRKQFCKNYGDAKNKVIAMFDSQLEINSVNKEIYARANRTRNSYRQLVSDYDDPVSTLESLVESSRRTENKAHAAREQEAWGRVVQAASNPNVQSNASDQFKRNYESINEILISQAALNSSDSQINQRLRKTKSHLEKNPIKLPTVASTSSETTPTQALNQSKAACDAKGGRFDASRNNCTIVTQYQTAVVQQLGMNTVSSGSTRSQTSSNATITSSSSSTTSAGNRQGNSDSSSSSSSSSNSGSGSGHNSRTQPEENQWKIRTECGNTNFDKTMPEAAEVCRHTAQPLWEMHWHYKPFFDGIHLVRLSLKNTSNVPLEFVMRGTVSADMSHRNFDWRVVVPANSTRTKTDGLDLDDVPHVMDIKHLKYRRANQ